MRPGSVDSLGQGHDDPFGPAHVRHAPDVLVLTDAADETKAVRSQPVDNLLESSTMNATLRSPSSVDMTPSGPARGWLPPLVEV